MKKVPDVTRWMQHWAFDGYQRWMQALSQLSTWPHWQPSQLTACLSAGVEFSAQTGKLKAGLDASDLCGSYVEQCLRGAVPTRHDNLHDLLNALVWARFPRAKRALCERQASLARARGVIVGERVRDREQDACAMVDEGGMIVGPTTRAIFGHAALEDIVLGRDLRPFIVHVDDDDLDVGLARVLSDAQPIPRVRERHTLLATT